MQPTPQIPRVSRLHRPAFTLIEMLVVVAIISILMTAGSIGLSSMGGKGVTSGVATAEALFDEARTTAMGRNLRSCVLVSKNLTNSKGEDLRRIIVAYEATDATGKPLEPDNENPNWVLSSRGAVLPDQTFFSGKFSLKNHESGSGTIDVIDDTKIKDAAGAVLKPNSPFKGDYYIYEFNSQGIARYPGASFIIGNGARNATQSATGQFLPKVTASAKRDFGGFVIWRNGRTSVFRSPEQMGGVSSLNSGDQF